MVAVIIVNTYTALTMFLVLRDLPINLLISFYKVLLLSLLTDEQTEPQRG